ncbi:MAG: toprim domain-containing protein [Cyclobacteriaceae bacterium]|jgi:DNA primase
MEISEIKAQLTIAQVLDHYGLKPDKNNRLNCPFHADKTPSMQVYPETNTVFCFSSNCKLHGRAIDQIDFILHKEGISKHSAIIRAQELLGHTSNEKEQPPFEKLFKVFQANIKKSESAKAYLQNRKVRVELSQAGFNATGWSQMKHCIIFPLTDKEDKIVSFYGRSIYDKNEARHFYSRDRKGLYPRWPVSSATTLILTESVIDAATLYQLDDVRSHLTAVLACYGTNGFTPDHEQAIKELKHLEEVIIFFDGDEAGREGSKRIADKIHQLKPEIKLSSVNTPEGEDVNSLAQSHEKEIFTHLLSTRKFFSSNEEKKPQVKPVANPQFDTSNPHKIIYRTLSANYYIKGGLRNEADSMRVSLDIEHPQNNRKSRSKVDLYEDKQVERIAREAAEKLQLRADLIQLDLEVFTELLEQHRESTYAKAPVDNENKISLQFAKPALEFLSKPNLIKRWNDLIGKAGVIGEENSRIFLMAIAITHKMREPLHALIQGSSGSGKTHLMAKVYNFIPQQDKKNFTRVTEGSLYNYGMYDLQNKLICIEDLDGMKEEAQFAFRELQSKGMIISSTSTKDDNGNISAQEKTVYGPIASMSCTTKGEIYEDNMSRCFIIAVDESHEQSKKVIYYQNQKASGQIDEVKEKQCTEFIQTMVTLLKSYDVVNPYADKVHLPEEAHKIRRLNGLYQAFVKAITLMHQYQRKKDSRGRLISEKEDLQIAAEILFESILLKVDELDGSLRQFYEQLKAYIKTKGNDHYEFGQREVRQVLHVSKTQLHRYLHDLEQLEYIRQSGGYANRGFNYKVLYWDNVQVMRSKVKRHLQGQLDQLELATA